MITVEWIAGVALSGLWVVLVYAIKRNIKNNDDRFKKIEDKMDKLDDDIECIRGNYLKKFADQKDHTTDKIAEVLEKISEYKLENLAEHSKILITVQKIESLLDKQ